eukprot:642976-Pelagomonas_calceolata.AAC.4
MTWKLQDVGTTAASDTLRRAAVSAAAAGGRCRGGAGAAQLQGKAGAKPPGGQRVFSLVLAKAVGACVGMGGCVCVHARVLACLLVCVSVDVGYGYGAVGMGMGE